MLNNKNRLIQTLLWFLPTWIEVAIYVFVAMFTIFISNLSFVNQFLFASGDFNPIRAAVDSISFLLERVVGEQIAGSLSLAIFWGLVGLMVNVIWWIGSNFSTELNNDLVFSNYVHPKNYDPKSPLREFVSRTILRAGIAIILIFYVNFIIRVGLPRISTLYNRVIATWNEQMDFTSIIFGIILQVLLLHGLAVLVRLLLLRKQIFSN